MNQDIQAYNNRQESKDAAICTVLMHEIDRHLTGATCTIWHAHPVWFINGNPIVGYSKLKHCVRLLFWSGADFGEADLQPGTGKFKDASIDYTATTQVNIFQLKRWLKQSQRIQWDYKNIVKRKGKLERLMYDRTTV